MTGSAALFALALFLLAACGGDQSADPVGPTVRPGPTPVPTDSTADPDTGGAIDPAALAPAERQTVEAAIADLTERTGTAADEIKVVSFERVTWNDGSLGCPQPGKMYTQALVDGSRTVLAVAGVTYHYHAGSDGDPVLCDQPDRGTTPPTDR